MLHLLFPFCFWMVTLPFFLPECSLCLCVPPIPPALLLAFRFYYTNHLHTVYKYPITASWGGYFIWLTLQRCFSPVKEVRTGTETGHDPRGRSWCRETGGELITDLLPLACWTHLLLEFRTNNPEMTPPTNPLAPRPTPHQQLITKWENVLHFDLKETFPQLRLLLMMTLAGFKLTHKTTWLTLFQLFSSE